MKKIITVIAALLMTITASAQHGKYVGGDISILPLYEEHNSGYLDGNGKKINDLLTWFVDSCGWNTFRVRLFVNPVKKNGKGETDNCVCQDLDYVKKLGKRIKDAGAKFMLDFHYSDTWADPSYQTIPASWTDTSTDGLSKSISDYTASCLKEMKEYGAEPDFVQIGNEISYGMLWRNNSDKVYPAMAKSNNTAGWARLSTLLNAASKAVRANSNAKIIVHIERSGQPTAAVNFYNYISDVDYDIIGLSYYPFYHGYLPTLANTLAQLSASFPTKKIQIVETSYFFQYFPGDATYTTTGTWPASANGQYAFIKDLIAKLADYENVDGLSYWQPEEGGCGDDTNWNTTKIGTVMTAWTNRGLWWLDQTQSGHWPVKADEGMVAYLMKDFLSPDAGKVYGDVNGDGNVDINDVNAIISVICGDDTFAATADVNGSGTVDINDVNAVIGVICGQ